MSISGGGGIVGGGGGGHTGGDMGATSSDANAAYFPGGGTSATPKAMPHFASPFDRPSSTAQYKSPAQYSTGTPVTTGQFSLPELHHGMMGVVGTAPFVGDFQAQAGSQPGWGGGGGISSGVGRGGGLVQQQQVSSVSSMDTSSFAITGGGGGIAPDTRPVPTTSRSHHHFPHTSGFITGLPPMGLPEGLPPSLFRSSSAAYVASPTNNPFRTSGGRAAAAVGSTSPPMGGSTRGREGSTRGGAAPASSVGGVSGEEVWVHTVVEGNHVLVTTQPLPSIPDLITIHLPPSRKQQQSSSGAAGGGGGGGGGGDMAAGALPPPLRQYGSCSASSLRICIEELHLKLERCRLGGLHQGA